VAHYKLRDYAQARADFDQVVRLEPAFADGYAHRALAAQALRQYDAAIADLTRALERTDAPTRYYFLRARARARAGDADGARRDREEGLRRRPTDEAGWVEYGLARLADDPAAALDDFRQAERLNPRSFPALQNQAYVLAEKLGRTEEAITRLDRALELYPQSVPARAGRAVLLARLGRTEAALADAGQCLAADNSPVVAFQVAGVYALAAKDDPGHAREAVRLLARAVGQGFGGAQLDTDPDLAPLRSREEFRRLRESVAAVQQLQK
jgi:tetratricopeptide (TPR) repeat protein